MLQRLWDWQQSRQRPGLPPASAAHCAHHKHNVLLFPLGDLSGLLPAVVLHFSVCVCRQASGARAAVGGSGRRTARRTAERCSRRLQGRRRAPGIRHGTPHSSAVRTPPQRAHSGHTPLVGTPATAPPAMPRCCCRLFFGLPRAIRRAMEAPSRCMVPPSAAKARRQNPDRRAVDRSRGEQHKRGGKQQATPSAENAAGCHSRAGGKAVRLAWPLPVDHHSRDPAKQSSRRPRACQGSGRAGTRWCVTFRSVYRLLLLATQEDQFRTICARLQKAELLESLAETRASLSSIAEALQASPEDPELLEVPHAGRWARQLPAAPRRRWRCTPARGPLFLPCRAASCHRPCPPPDCSFNSSCRLHSLKRRQLWQASRWRHATHRLHPWSSSTPVVLAPQAAHLEMQQTQRRGREPQHTQQRSKCNTHQRLLQRRSRSRVPRPSPARMHASTHAAATLWKHQTLLRWPPPTPRCAPTCCRRAAAAAVQRQQAAVTATPTHHQPRPRASSRALRWASPALPRAASSRVCCCAPTSGWSGGCRWGSWCRR